MNTAPATLDTALSDSRFASPSMRRVGRYWFWLGSAVLHGLVLSALLILAHHGPATMPRDETATEMVFQQGDEPRPPDVPPLDAPPRDAPSLDAPLPEAPVGDPPPVDVPPPEPTMTEPPEPPEKIAEPPPVVTPPAPAITPEPAPITHTATPPPKPRPLPRPTMDKAPVPTSAPVAPPPVQSIAPPLPSPVATALAVDPSWQKAVSGWLSAAKTYPDEARRRAEEGRVTIRFTVDRSGRVLDATIIGSSGSQLLDQAALALLRQASLPAFPVSMMQAQMTITTALRYSLR